MRAVGLSVHHEIDGDKLPKWTRFLYNYGGISKASAHFVPGPRAIIRIAQLSKRWLQTDPMGHGVKYRDLKILYCDIE